MAYVESYYIDANEESIEAPKNQSDDSLLMNYVIESNTPLTGSVIGRIVAREEKEVEKKLELEEELIESSYCGFDGAELPPIYREQMRKARLQNSNQTQKTVIIKQNYQQANVVDSIMDARRYFAPPPKISQQNLEFAAHSPAILTNNIYTQDYNTLDIISTHDYFPGFSAPKTNDFVLTRQYQDAPKTLKTETNNSQKNVEQSSYLVMSHEDFHQVNAPPKKAQNDSISTIGSLSASSMANSSTISTHTAKRGPAFGSQLSAPNRNNKYRGLSAFRPVGESTQSQYAYDDLN